MLQGETDWKVMCIDVTDPMAENLNDIHDIEKLMPGFLTVKLMEISAASDALDILFDSHRSYTC